MRPISLVRGMSIPFLRQETRTYIIKFTAMHCYNCLIGTLYIPLTHSTVTFVSAACGIGIHARYCILLLCKEGIIQNGLISSGGYLLRPSFNHLGIFFSPLLDPAVENVAAGAAFC
jgi:hypothetical protein